MLIDFECLVHDEVNDLYLLYGGGFHPATSTNVDLGSNDLRALPAVGGEWTKLLPKTVTQPAPRFGQTMHFDPKLRQFFELGGIDAAELPQESEIFFLSLDSAVITAAYAVPAIRISGQTWTPNRNSDGTVRATDWTQLPMNTWLYVGTHNLASLLSATAYPNGSGTDASGNIIRPWGGAAWDATNQVMYITGGGHGDTSHCETEIISIALSKLNYQLEQDRQPLSVDQSWNESSRTFQTTPALYPGYSTPLANGVPGALHTFWALCYIPSSTWGNKRGAIFIGGHARSVYDLDSGTYTTCHWYKQPATYVQENPWGNAVCILDGLTIWRPHSSFYWGKYRLSGTETTGWSSKSFGQYVDNAASSSRAGVPVSNKIFCEMPARRELVLMDATGVRTRVRVGAASDASASDFSAYTDAIVLSSSDGSHNDFNSSNLAQSSDGKGNGILADAGAHYDAGAGCIWICPNYAEAPMYRISGISSNTWTVSRLASTTAPLMTGGCTNGTFGRFRVADINGVKVGLRVSGKDEPMQVVRLG